MHGIRISNLARSVLEKLEKQSNGGHLEKYTVIINHLNILDKEWMMKSVEETTEARAREAYYKELSSYPSKRYISHLYMTHTIALRSPYI
jgi:hypothetical protein